MRNSTDLIQWRGWLMALGLLTLLWALFFWRILTPTAADRVIFAKGDFTVQFYSNSTYQVEQINQGRIPLWQPYNYGGEPFAANLQLAAWYPPRWLAAALLGTADGWQIEDFQIEVAIHYWLASVFTLGFVRLWSRRWLVAMAAALMFSYGGFLAGYTMLQVSILECAVWLPLMLTGAHLSVQRGWMLRGAVLMGLAIGMSFLPGHPQTTMQAAYVAVAYLAFAGYHRGLSWRAITGRIALAGMVGLGISMIQLLPSAEFTLLSYRVDEYGYLEKSTGFTFSLMGNIIWPALDGEWAPLYIGTPGIILAASALLRPQAETLFWGGVTILALGIAMGRNSVIYDLFYILLPGLNLFRLQEHLAFSASFALVMVAAHQLHTLLEAEPVTRRKVLWMVVGLMVWHGLVFALSQDASTFVSRDTLLFTLVVTGLFAYWLHHLHGKVLPWLLLALVVFDLFTVTGRSKNFVEDLPENRVTAPQALKLLQTRPAEAITWRVDGAAGLEANNIIWRVPDIYGIGPVSMRSTEELRRLPVERRWEVFAVRYVTLIDEPPANTAVELVAYDRSDSGQEFRVFEINDPRPFAHLVYNYRVALENPEFARQMMADPRVVLREMAITTLPLPFDLPAKRPEISTVDDLLFESPEHLQMKVSTGANALLTVAIPNYPGWYAEVNGSTVPIIDTYAGLIGIPLEPGENQQVTLRFDPPTQHWGALLTLTTLLAGCTLMLIEWRYQRPKSQHEEPAYATK